MQIKKFLRYISSFIFGYTLEKTSSHLNPVLEVCYINGKTYLNAENVNYSFGSCHDVFNILFKKINLKTKPLENILILGFGVGCTANLLRNTYQKNSKIVGIEKDEKVIELGRKYFQTDKFSDISVLCIDAVEFMEKNKDLYDLIVVDIFIDYVVPETCEQEVFLNNLKRSLSPSGILVFNKLEINKQETSTLDALKSSFKITMPEFTIHQIYKDEPNYMFVYTKSA